jgi:CRISPR-associated protein Csm1
MPKDKLLSTIVQKYILGDTGYQSDSLEKALTWLNIDPSVLWQPAALQPILGTGFYFQPQSLTIEKSLERLKGSFFPTTVQPNEESLKNHWKELNSKLKENINDEKALLRILEIYGTSITIKGATVDISLFDIAKSAAALATCFEESQTDSVCIIGGGLTGIQPYLYDIVSKNAAKLLKGRSFYIQLLLDSILEKFLKEFGFESYQVLYSSGGNFFVLVPNTEGVRNQFERFKSEIEKAVFEEHKTQLFVSLDISKPITKNKPLNEQWKAFFKQMDRLKFNRLHNRFADDDLFNEMFTPSESGGLRERDSITNEEFDEDEEKELNDVLIQKKKDSWDKVHYLNYDENNIPDIATATRNRTFKQIKVGRQLSETERWIISNNNLQEGRKDVEFEVLDVYHYFLKQNSRLNINGSKEIFLNKPTELQDFTFYGGDKVPMFEAGETDADGIKLKERQPKSFSDLTDAPVRKLAILRMDVDNLGIIMKSDKLKTFAHYAAISRSLDFFFKGYLNKLREEYAEKTIIIYSGGDDLFIVGNWKDVLNFTCDINDSFKHWVTENKDMTISGGAVILPHKFPIMQGARLAEEAEKKAKKYSNTEGGNATKNAITLFNIPLCWDTDFKIVRALKEKLSDLYAKDKPPKGLLQKIIQHATDQQEQIEKGKTQKWRWLVSYDFSQMAREANQMDLKIFLNDLKEAMFSEQFEDNDNRDKKYSMLQLLAVAARWVELEERQKEKSIDLII